mgnify:CR=1 FL=1
MVGGNGCRLTFSGKEVRTLAKTKAGKKIVPVKPHKRVVGHKTQRVRGHRRSTPN